MVNEISANLRAGIVERGCVFSSFADETYEGVNATAAGWGTLHENGKPTCVLHEVQVPVMSNDACRRTNYNHKMITDNMMCAGLEEGKKDACQVGCQGRINTALFAFC